MSCDHKNGQCICKIVTEIADAQAAVTDDACAASCKRSIRNLLGATPSGLDTIPFMLICKDGCEYFIGRGIYKNTETMAFDCIESPVFRVSKIIEGTCCAVLELLQPQTDKGEAAHSYEKKDVCDFFPEGCIKKFIRTGICITVDLNCFCGIECLTPVKAKRGRPVTNPKPKPCPVPVPHHDKPVIFQEEICGNFGPGTQTVWESTHTGTTIEGTFQIFNSSSSDGSVEAVVTASPNVVFPDVLPQTTISREANLPVAFTIAAPPDTYGTYCITLYKKFPNDKKGNKKAC